MKDISERAFPKGHFDEGHFEGRAFPKGERAKGMKGIVHKLEFPQISSKPKKPYISMKRLKSTRQSKHCRI